MIIPKIFFKFMMIASLGHFVFAAVAVPTTTSKKPDKLSSRIADAMDRRNQNLQSVPKNEHKFSFEILGLSSDISRFIARNFTEMDLFDFCRQLMCLNKKHRDMILSFYTLALQDLYPKLVVPDRALNMMMFGKIIKAGHDSYRLEDLLESDLYRVAKKELAMTNDALIKNLFVKSLVFGSDERIYNNLPGFLCDFVKKIQHQHGLRETSRLYIADEKKLTSLAVGRRASDLEVISRDPSEEYQLIITNFSSITGDGVTQLNANYTGFINIFSSEIGLIYLDTLVNYNARTQTKEEFQRFLSENNLFEVITCLVSEGNYSDVIFKIFESKPEDLKAIFLNYYYNPGFAHINIRFIQEYAKRFEPENSKLRYALTRTLEAPFSFEEFDALDSECQFELRSLLRLFIRAHSLTFSNLDVFTKIIRSGRMDIDRIGNDGLLKGIPPYLLEIVLLESPKPVNLFTNSQGKIHGFECEQAMDYFQLRTIVENYKSDDPLLFLFMFLAGKLNINTLPLKEEYNYNRRYVFDCGMSNFALLNFDENFVLQNIENKTLSFNQILKMPHLGNGNCIWSTFFPSVKEAEDDCQTFRVSELIYYARLTQVKLNHPEQVEQERGININMSNLSLTENHEII